MTEIGNIKKDKDKKLKEEKELIENFIQFSKDFDILYEKFSNYITSIKDIDVLDENHKNNIKLYKTKITNRFEEYENIKCKFELSRLFYKNINLEKINNLIDEVLELKNNSNESENISYYKSNSNNYSNFYDDLNNNDNELSGAKEPTNLYNKINIINETLKCYECGTECTQQCTDRKCCNFLFCDNCFDIRCENNEKINHKLKKIEGKESKDKERKIEKYLDLISEIFKYYLIQVNALLEKEIFPIFPDKKDKQWQHKYLDEIEQLYNKINNNNNKSYNMNECKICKRIIKKLLDKIIFKLPVFFFS